MKLPRLTILDRYIIKKFIGTFFVALALIIVIVIIFDISEKIDDFVDNEVSLREIAFTYYANFIPYFMNMFSDDKENATLANSQGVYTLEEVCAKCGKEVSSIPKRRRKSTEEE